MFNRDHRLLNHSMGSLSIYAGAVSSILLLFFYATSTTITKVILLNSLPQIVLGAGVAWCCLFTMVLALSAGAHESQKNLILLAASAALAGCILAVTTSLLAIGTLSTESYFIICAITTVGEAFFITHIGAQFMQLAGEWPGRLATVYAAFIAILATGFAMSINWLDPITASRYLRITYGLLLAMLPLVCLCTTIYIDGKVAPNMRMLDLVRHRFRSNKHAVDEFRALTVIIGGYIASLSAAMLFGYIQKKVPTLAHFSVAFESLDYAFLGLLYFTLKSFDANNHARHEDNLTASLANASARRFMMRHRSTKNAWAVTSGLRAPSFVLNHDPDSFVTNSLPASLVQIRNNEIQRCVNDLLAKSMLNYNASGPQIYGTVNPEFSMHPCIDLLCAFASLHLDAMPLVERRLSGLIDLLPILDPQLAQMVQSKKMQKILSRNLWLFHFDYHWVDQQILHNNSNIEYGVVNHSYGGLSHGQIYDTLRKKNQLGSFIWIGEKARERLTFEAPMLANIIHALPVQTADHEEQLSFLVRFEELIPRLQTYYNLDRRRQVLKEYETSIEGQRFVNILNLQIPHVTGPAQIEGLLSALTSYPWRGFKEKDRALQVLIKLYAHVIKTFAARMDNPLDLAREMEGVRHSFIDATTKIGYPSQILHLAHLDKFAMRHSDSIIGNAQSPWNPRFFESWTLLATLEIQNYASPELIRFLDFLKSVPQKRDINQDPFVVAKAIEALGNIGHAAKSDHLNLVNEALNAIGLWIIKTAISPDFFSRYLDTYFLLAKVHGDPIALSAAVTKGIDGYLERLSKVQKDAGLSAEVNGLISRWNQTEHNMQRVS